jgi:dynein heavy chain
MDGPMQSVVPDVVEQEVANFGRTLYKLEKGFSEVPTAKKIANRVSVHTLSVLSYRVLERSL